MIERASAPLYEQIKEDMKAAIQEGKYKTKQRIPSEAALSEEYSVSRITIRRAVEELCTEGYLVKMQGRGTFVNTPRINRKFASSSKVESFSQTCVRNGLKPGAKLIDCKIIPSRHDEQAFFGLEEDALLIYVERIRTADMQAIFLENLFLPYDDNKELLSAELDDTSLFDTIEQFSGRRPCDIARRTIEVTKASAKQARQLGVPLGEPLLFLNVYFMDAQNKPLCIGRQYYIGSRYMFEF